MSRVLSCRYSAHSFYVLAINNSFVGLAYDPSEPSIRWLVLTEELIGLFGTLEKSNTSRNSGLSLDGEEGAELPRYLTLGLISDSKQKPVDEDIRDSSGDKGSAIDWALAGDELPGEKTWVSKPNSCPMKLKFGDIILRFDFTYSYASSMRSRLVAIRYAMQIVAERLMPAWQWINTFPPQLFTESKQIIWLWLISSLFKAF